MTATLAGDEAPAPAGEASAVATADPATAMNTTIHVDLAMGAWSPGHAAGEIAAQLGISLPEYGDPAEENIINRGVDREARGDGTLIAALDAARRIAAAMPMGATIALARPRFGLPMRTENRALLRYLARLGVAIACVAPGRDAADDLPQTARVYPGLIPPRILAAMGVAPEHPALCATADGRFAIDPAARTIDPHACPLLIDRLAAFEGGDARLFAFCQYLGSPLFVDAPKLAGAAQAAVQQSADLALDLAAKARACARTPIDIATAELQLQGIRIFLHRFDAVAAMPDPSPRLPAALRRELYTLRGWGKVMTGDVAEAERCFAAGSEDADEDATRTDALYGRNIAALARFRAGDVAGARAIEEAIAEDLAAQDDPDPQLCFVNALNLARLARAAGDDDYYRTALARAFATSDNVRSLSEIIQLNWLRGEAIAAADPAGAGQSWLRAAFAWLALEPVEALSIRAVRALFGMTPIPPARIDAAGSALIAARLEAAWPAVAPIALDTLPQVLLSDDVPCWSIDGMVAIDGVAIGRSQRHRPMLPRARATLTLASRAFAILTAGQGTPADIAAGSWIIDAATGCDVRADAVDQAASRWRHGLINDATDLRVGIGPAIRSAKAGARGITLRFNRHRPPITLTGDEAAIFRKVATDGPVAIIDLPAASHDLIRLLVEQRALGIGLAKPHHAA